MKTQAVAKKNQIITKVFWVVIALSTATIFMQYRYINELKGKLTEKNQSVLSAKENSVESKTVDLNSKDSVNDKDKIKNLESKITGMQSWQDYLEKSLKKYQTEEDEKETKYYRERMDSYSRYIKGFAEENDIPSDMASELINLLTERDLEGRDLSHGSSEMSQLYEKYDALISELLSNKYPTYLEYKKHDSARRYLRQFRMSVMRLDGWLDKQQQKEMVNAIYNDSQIFQENNKKDIDQLNNVTDINLESMNIHMELQKKLHNRYLDSAKNILSDSQLKDFQKYLDSQIAEQEAKNKKLEAILKLQEDWAKKNGDGKPQ